MSAAWLATARVRSLAHTGYIIASAAALLLAMPAAAEIFWRTGGAAENCLRELGGTRVYATGVTLNGTPGTLTAHAVPDTSSRVAASLARRLGLGRDAGLGGALISHAEKGRLQRLLVLPSPASDERCVVLTFEQSARDAARAKGATPPWPEGLPALAAQPTFSAVCDATRTTFVTAESAESPEAATQSAAQALIAAGWTQTPPAAPAFRTFVSGLKTCVVFANTDTRTSRTSISLLHREGAAR